MAMYEYPKENHFFPLLVMVSIVFLLALGLFLFAYSKRQLTIRRRTPLPTGSPTQTATPIESVRSEFETASSSAREFHTADGNFSFSVPAGWIQERPDSSFDVPDTNVATLQFRKEVEVRPFPLGRITLQYANKAGLLVQPDSVITPETKTIHGILYTILHGDEHGSNDDYSYEVWYGHFEASAYFVRFFSRFQTQVENDEQDAFLSSFTGTVY